MVNFNLQTLISICSVYNIHAAPYILTIKKLWRLHIGKILTLSLVKGILYFTLWYIPSMMLCLQCKKIKIQSKSYSVSDSSLFKLARIFVLGYAFLYIVLNGYVFECHLGLAIIIRHVILPSIMI